MTEYVELYIDQGTNFNTTISIQDDLTNLAQNVEGYIIRSQLRRSLLSVNASANLACYVSNAANGEMTISLDSANTSNLRPGTYFYDIKVIDTNNGNNTTRLIEGVIFVTPEITV
jgi:hypothetical protein